MSLAKINEANSVPNDTDLIYANSKNLKDALQVHPSCVQSNLVSKGNFFMHDVLLHLLDIIPSAAVTITTFSMTEMSARIIANCMDKGMIKTLRVLMDKDSRKRYPSVHQIIMNCATEYVLTGVHAKVLIVEDENDIYTVSGSHNWTKNPRLEVSTFFLDTHTAAFHKQWIDKEMKNGYRIK